jgi:hypothetical protein
MISNATSAKASNITALADTALAWMKLKVKRFPNIHGSRIQEREGALDEKNRKLFFRQRQDRPRAITVQHKFSCRASSGCDEA